MARQSTDPRAALIQSANKSGAEAKRLFEHDLNRRLADEAKILTADDMAEVYSPKKGLFTTIDGKPRMLTYDDILAFRAAVKDVQRRHGKQNGGILVRQVIDLSAPDDRKRANSEIHTVIPVNNRAGVVHFQTNSGPNSNVSRHHVMVQFLSYDAALSGGLPVAEAAKLLARGKIRLDCDCGRHTFWYRYIATIGNFNFGRQEDGYPKIRNPKLYGLACKHVLRVMAVIAHGATFTNFAKRMLEHGRKTLSNKRQVMTVQEQQEFLANANKARKRDRTVSTTEEKRAARASQPAQQRRAAERIKAANDQLRKTHTTKVNKPISRAKKNAAIQALIDAGYSPAAAQAAIATADTVKG